MLLQSQHTTNSIFHGEENMNQGDKEGEIFGKVLRKILRHDLNRMISKKKSENLL